MISNTSGVIEIPIITKYSTNVIVSHDDNDNNGEPLIDIKRDNNNIIIKDLNGSKAWLVVKDSSLSGGGVILHEGDIIKLGRVELKVRQLAYDVNNNNTAAMPCCSSSTVCSDDYDDNNTEIRLLPKGVSKESSMINACINNGINGTPINGIICKICLMNGCNKYDPFIAPCKCSGSIKYVHLNCLRHWIAGRLRLPKDINNDEDEDEDEDGYNNNITSRSSGSMRRRRRRRTAPFLYRALKCELCKAVYPKYVNINGIIECLYPLPKVKPPFIVFQLNLKPTTSTSIQQRGEDEDEEDEDEENIGLNVVSLDGDNNNKHYYSNNEDEDEDEDIITDHHHPTHTTNTHRLLPQDDSIAMAMDELGRADRSRINNNNNKHYNEQQQQQRQQQEQEQEQEEEDCGIIIGRGHESEVRITDVSISRKHALLKYKNGNFFIKDLHSKFGTLLLLPSEGIILPQPGTIAIQVGRTVLRIIARQQQQREEEEPQPRELQHYEEEQQQQPSSTSSSRRRIVEQDDILNRYNSNGVLTNNRISTDRRIEREDYDNIMILPETYPSSSIVDNNNGLVNPLIEAGIDNNDDNIMMIPPPPPPPQSSSSSLSGEEMDDDYYYDNIYNRNMRIPPTPTPLHAPHGYSFIHHYPHYNNIRHTSSSSSYNNNNTNNNSDDDD